MYCFKQRSSNFTCILLRWFTDDLRILLDVAGALILSSDNPFDFHAEILLLLEAFLKYLKTGWNIK